MYSLTFKLSFILLVGVVSSAIPYHTSSSSSSSSSFHQQHRPLTTSSSSTSSTLGTSIPTTAAVRRVATPNNLGHVTLQEFLASQGIKNDQITILVIAPQNVINGQRSLYGGGGSGKSLNYGVQSLASNTYAQSLQPGAAVAGAQQQQQPVLVEAPAQPISVHYKSQSVPLNLHHTHIPAPTQETKLSRSEEEPQRIVHEVIRPVIQEVREIIQPYRRIIQEIRPVQESVVSKVSVAGKNGTSVQHQQNGAAGYAQI